MIKSDRKDLIIKIIHLANLPPGKVTTGYMTRKQLIELMLYIEGLHELLRKCKEMVRVVRERGLVGNGTKRT